MNYLIQRGKVRGQVINVPDGLPELLSDIAREALRCQPTKECLCQFIIDYLHSVIVTRDKALVAKSIIDRALHNVDEIISDMCICDITKEKAEEMARVMEECFRRFLEKRRCERGKEKEIIRFDQEDLLDELIKKCKFSEDELKISRPLIEEAYNRFVQAYMAAADNTDGTEALYQYFREREIRRWEEKLRNDAATKIQANFRGFLVRRSLIDRMLPKISHLYNAGPLGDIPSELYRDMDKAARVIQKFFKEKFPTFVKEEEYSYEEEEQLSICSHKSKETIVEGEGIGETAPDEIPPQETAPTEVVVEEAEGEVEAEAGEIEVPTEEVKIDVEATTEIEAEPAVEPAPAEAAPAPAAEPEPVPEPVPEPAPEPEPTETADAPAEAPSKEPDEEGETAAEPAEEPAQE